MFHEKVNDERILYAPSKILLEIIKTEIHDTMEKSNYTTARLLFTSSNNIILAINDFHCPKHLASNKKDVILT